MSTVKVWLVTGCSSGLGRELVLAILARGDKVIATARRLSDLDYIKSIDGAEKRVLVVQLDVTQSFNQLQGKVDEAIGHFGSIDVLCTNASFIDSGVWEELG